jgi:hypothetical protein
LRLYRRTGSRSDEGIGLFSDDDCKFEVDWDNRDRHTHEHCHHFTRQQQRRQSTMTSTTRNRSKLVEISPGTFVSLRGSEETWDFVKSGRKASTACKECSARLLCINTVNMVMCPKCHVIFPIEGRRKKASNDGGVGRGMIEDDALLELNRIG